MGGVAPSTPDLDSRLRGNDGLGAAVYWRCELSSDGEAPRRLHPRQPAQRNALHGVTSDLVRRVWEHRNDLAEGFTKRYRCHTLVYFEQHVEMNAAILREKQMKKWNRAWKIELIERGNPTWRDLWPEISS